MSEPFDDLDSAARANLDAGGVSRHMRYKQDLLQGSEKLESILEILAGFIWDESEELSSPQ